jgi:hypothetical protein
LQYDIEGRPLTARYIAGRKYLGGADEALTPAELDAAAEATLGSKPETVEARALRRATVGSYDPNTNSIRVLRTLDDPARNMVAAHEVSHGIDDLAGALEFDGRRVVRTIPQAGIKRELGTVYNDLNNSYLASARAKKPDVEPENTYWGTGVTPTRTFGYKPGLDADRELNAEAIRAYIADPNYLKTVAPKTAARIREFVNENPRLSKIIQFNSLVGGALAGNPSLIPVDHDPFAQ